ncbi:biotin--[acetyl-CoA-carboxylase] ligase [Polycladomyces subterraneus]|uniref:Bifunctional ligase/repressor BirA n=1 Tax=Polycladomyces subterraneus TaxID=1016997 RepID=A0ABT8IKF5_9BACL|nr:biotin--[acetyl-CoA-carboxylase] ligase [Polycladomyces subterraneus]MDN4593258.1 biotin--[acetyl-CoA-carboxylase] ligase [Polycladomyces subterraneus]
MGSEIRERLLALLIEHAGHFVSGEEISRQLGCTRTAIWKHIDELRKAGYEIEARPKAGYCLRYQPDRIAPEEIKALLSTRRFGHAIHYVESVESTQWLAHQGVRSGAEEGALFLADEQKQGRGRMGRKWHSPPRSGIWMSLLLRPPIPLNLAPQLTLMASVGVTRAIRRETGLPVTIKWPNDLLIDGRKVCGILTELRGEQDQIHYVVLGIGVNVNTPATSFPEDLKTIATSLAAESGRTYRRAKLIAAILEELEYVYDLYLSEGFETIRHSWESFACMLGQSVTAHTPQGPRQGIAKGLHASGALLLETDEGIVPVYSADIRWYEQGLPN